MSEADDSTGIVASTSSGTGSDANTSLQSGLAQTFDWKGLASQAGTIGVNIAEGLSSANNVNSSSSRSANIRYGISKGLISSGNPYAMAAGAALAGLQASGGFADTSMTKGDALAESMGLGKSYDTKNKILSWAIPGAGWFAKKTQSYDMSDELKSMSSAYSGTSASALTAQNNSSAKLMGRRNRKKMNNFINEVQRQDNLIQDIYNNNKDNQNAQLSMSQMLSNNVTNNLLGGMNYNLARAARLGGILSKRRERYDRVAKSFWDSVRMKQGGALEVETKEDKLARLFWENVKMTTNPQKFQDGGTMNVIPEGNLHARKHHMEDDEHITKKGIPVIDAEGHQQAEIEVNELILTYEVTKTIEAWWKEWESTEDLQRKNELAIICGKYLCDQLMNNTDDRTGLIKKTKI